MFTPAQLQDRLRHKYRKATLVAALRRAVDWNDAWGHDDALLLQLVYAERLAPPWRVVAADFFRKRGAAAVAAEMEREGRAILHQKHVWEGRALVEKLRDQFRFPAETNPYDELAHAMGHIVLRVMEVEEAGVYAEAAAAAVLVSGGSEM